MSPCLTRCHLPKFAANKQIEKPKNAEEVKGETGKGINHKMLAKFKKVKRKVEYKFIYCINNVGYWWTAINYGKLRVGFQKNC